jgi:Flp pilus assembly protein TadG
MVESALAMLVFAVLVAGVMELGLVLFVSNSIAFAAQRAARYASIRGNASGHPATVGDIQANAQSYATPLANGALSVAVSWTPNNTPGSTVQVSVSYSIRPLLLPLSPGMLTLQSTARQTIAQ